MFVWFFTFTLTNIIPYSSACYIKCTGTTNMVHHMITSLIGYTYWYTSLFVVVTGISLPSSPIIVAYLYICNIFLDQDHDGDIIKNWWPWPYYDLDIKQPQNMSFMYECKSFSCILPSLYQKTGIPCHHSKHKMLWTRWTTCH